MKKLRQAILNFFSDHSFHYVLCGLFFIVFNVNELSGELEWHEIWLPFTIIAASSFIIKSTFGFFLKEGVKASVATTVFLVAFLFYGNFFFILISIEPIKAILKEGYFILIVIALTLSGTLLIAKTSRSLKRLNFYLNVLFVTYIAFELPDLFRNFYNTNSIHVLMGGLKRGPKNGPNYPNVYLIVTDAYA